MYSYVMRYHFCTRQRADPLITTALAEACADARHRPACEHDISVTAHILPQECDLPAGSGAEEILPGGVEGGNGREETITCSVISVIAQHRPWRQSVSVNGAAAACAVSTRVSTGRATRPPDSTPYGHIQFSLSASDVSPCGAERTTSSVIHPGDSRCNAAPGRRSLNCQRRLRQCWRRSSSCGARCPSGPAPLPSGGA